MKPEGGSGTEVHIGRAGIVENDAKDLTNLAGGNGVALRFVVPVLAERGRRGERMSIMLPTTPLVLMTVIG